MLLTIFTPTYNRGYKIHELYHSLCNQTIKDFIWLVVDDGSTDDTYGKISQWIESEIICIKYIYQNNQGKHIAHNTGVDNCDTELFLCVDSDDYLQTDAVEKIIGDKNEIISNTVSGIVSPRVDRNGILLGTNMPPKIKYCSLSDLYEKYRFKGDTALVFKTEVLKKYKFPKIYGEKFIGEEYIYSQIDEKYKLYITEHKYYVCEYLNDGYTKNIVKVILENPKGYMLLKKTKLKMSKTIRTKYKSASLYIVGGWLSKEENILKGSPYKLITILAYPLAAVIYFVRFKRHATNLYKGD